MVIGHTIHTLGKIYVEAFRELRVETVGTPKQTDLIGVVYHQMDFQDVEVLLHPVLNKNTLVGVERHQCSLHVRQGFFGVGLVLGVVGKVQHSTYCHNYSVVNRTCNDTQKHALQFPIVGSRPLLAFRDSFFEVA